MIKNISKAAVVAAALVALPGIAQAGTATATGTATLNVVNQCTITGANVNLGTFSSKTWGDVAAETGFNTFFGNYTVGTKGYEGLNWGSVTCDNGTPYTVQIGGTGEGGVIKFTVNGKVVVFQPFVKKVGGTTIGPNTPWPPEWGSIAAHNYSVAAVGNGQAQTLLGSAPMYYQNFGATVVSTDQLTTAGTYTDSLTYTLNF